MSHTHEKVVCSCGQIIMQCRCIEGGNNVRVVQNGCDKCRGRVGETEDQRRERLKHAGWIGVDLDGTLAEWHGWKVSGGRIGPPISKMVERVKRWLAEGRDVRIFTARVGSTHDAAEVTLERHKVGNWCLENIGTVLAITCVKDAHMIELWDDRAVQVIKNTGERADGLRAQYEFIIARLRQKAGEVGRCHCPQQEGWSCLHVWAKEALSTFEDMVNRGMFTEEG